MTKIVFDTEAKKETENSVVTIGTFDGVHIGHKKIIKQLVKKAKQLNYKSVVVTFKPHPRTVVNNTNGIFILSTLEEKNTLLKELGVDKIYVINFTKEFAKKSYREFFDEILLEKNNAKHIIIGYDHKFGKDRLGDKTNLMEKAKENNIDITVVAPQEVDGLVVSSTKIRNALAEGNLELANKMLGRNYLLAGIVVEGSKRGRTLGYPTANIEPSEPNKLLPKNGVYFVKVFTGKEEHFGLLNVGLRPTFNNRVEPLAEVFILNFNKEIYGEKISVEFIKRIRNEIKFQTKEELIEQIKNDIEKVKQILNN